VATERSYICAHNINGTAAWYSTVAADAKPLVALPTDPCVPTSNQCFGFMKFATETINIEAQGALHSVLYPAKTDRSLKANVNVWYSDAPTAPGSGLTVYGARISNTAYGAASVLHHFSYNLYPVDTIAEVSCAPGFRPKGDSEYALQSKCTAGEWVPSTTGLDFELLTELECVPLDGCNTAPLQAYTSALLENIAYGGALSQHNAITCKNTSLTFSDSLLSCAATGFVNKLTNAAAVPATVCSAGKHCLVPPSFALRNTANGAAFDTSLLEHDIQHGQEIEVTCAVGYESTGVRPICYDGIIEQAAPSVALCRPLPGCAIPAHLSEVGTPACPGRICPIGVTPNLNCNGNVHQAVGVPVKCLANGIWSADIPAAMCVDVGCPESYLTGLGYTVATAGHNSVTTYTSRSWQADRRMYAYGTTIEVQCNDPDSGFVDLSSSTPVVQTLKFKCNVGHAWTIEPAFAGYDQACTSLKCDLRTVHDHYSAPAEMYINSARQLEMPLVTIGDVDLYAFFHLNQNNATLTVAAETHISVSCPGAPMSIMGQRLTCLAGEYKKFPNPCKSYCMSLDATKATGTAINSTETHSCLGDLVFPSNNVDTLKLKCSDDLQWVDDFGTVVTALPTCVKKATCSYVDSNGMKLKLVNDYLTCDNTASNPDVLFDLSAVSPRFARCQADGTAIYVDATGAVSAVPPTCVRVACEKPTTFFERAGEFQTDFSNTGSDIVALGTRVRLSCDASKQLMQSSPLYDVMATPVHSDVFAECTQADGWQFAGAFNKEHLFCASAECTLPDAPAAEDNYRYLTRPATADNTAAWTVVPIATPVIRVGYEYSVTCAADDHAPKRVHKICRHEVDTNIGALRDAPVLFSLLPSDPNAADEASKPFCERTTCDMDSISITGGFVQKFIKIAKGADTDAAFIRLSCPPGKAVHKAGNFATEVTSSCSSLDELTGYDCQDPCAESLLSSLYIAFAVNKPTLHVTSKFATPSCNASPKLYQNSLSAAGGFQCTPTGWQVITTTGLKAPTEASDLPVCTESACKVPAAFGDFVMYADTDLSEVAPVASSFDNDLVCPIGYAGSVIVTCHSGIWYANDVEIDALALFGDNCAPKGATVMATLSATSVKRDEYLRISVNIQTGDVPDGAADKTASFENCMRFFAFATVAKFGAPASVSCWTSNGRIEIVAAADSTIGLDDSLYILPGVVAVKGVAAVLSLAGVADAPVVAPIADFQVTQCQRAVVTLYATSNNYTRPFTVAWKVDGVAVAATTMALDLGFLKETSNVEVTVTNWLGASTVITVTVVLARERPTVAAGATQFVVMRGEGLTIPRFITASSCATQNGGVLSYAWIEYSNTVDAAVIPGIALNRHATTLVIPPKSLKSSVELDLIITETYSVASGLVAREFLLSDLQDVILIDVIDTTLVATVQNVEGFRQSNVWNHNVYDWDASLSLDGSHAHDTDVVGSVFDDRFHYRWECKFKASAPQADFTAVSIANAFDAPSSLDDCGLDYISANTDVNYENWEKENARFVVSNRDLVRLFDFDRHQSVNILIRLRVSKNGAASVNSPTVRVRLHNTVGATGYFVPSFELTAPGVAAAPNSPTQIAFGPSQTGIDVIDYAFLKTGVVQPLPSNAAQITITRSNIQYFPSDANIVLRPTISTPDSDFSSLFICTFDVHAAALSPLMNVRELVLDARYFRTIETTEAPHRCTYVIFPQRDVSEFDNVRDIIEAAIAGKWFIASATMHFAVVAPVQTKVIVSAKAQGEGMYLIDSSTPGLTAGACTHYRFYASSGTARSSIGSGRSGSIYTKLSPGAQSVSVDCIVAHQKSKLWRTYTGSVLVVVPGAQQLQGTAAATAALAAASEAIASNNAYFFSQAIPAALAVTSETANATLARAAYLQMIQSNPQLFTRAETTASAVASGEGAQLKLQALAGVLAQPKQTTPETVETTLKLQGEQIAALAQTSATTADSAKIALRTLVNAAAAAASHASPATSAAVIDALSQQLGPIVVTAIRSQSAPATIDSPLIMNEGSITITAFQASTATTGSAFAAGVAGHTLSADLFEQFAAKGINTVYSATVTLSNTHTVANAGANVPVNHVSQLVGVSLYGPNGVSLDTSDFGRARILIPHVGGFSGADFYFPTCQYFNAGSSAGELSSEADAWSTRGCRTQARTAEYTVCQCTHLTLFRARINYDGSDAWASLNNENVKDNMTPLYVIFVWMAVFVVFVLIAKAIDSKKKAEAIKLLMLQWHKDVELGAAPAGNSKASTSFTRTGVMMSSNQLFFSVFARNVFDPVASAPRMAFAMIVGLVGFALTAMFWGGIKTRNSLDNYAGVIFLAAVLLVVVNVIFAAVLRASHKSGPKEFLYTYALELAALYHTGTSTYFSKSEQGQLKSGANHNYRGVYQNILAEEKKGNTQTVRSLLRSAVVLDKKHVIKTLVAKDTATTGSAVAVYAAFTVLAIALAIIIVAFGIQLGLTVGTSVGKWIGTGFAAIALDIFILSPIVFFLASFFVADATQEEVRGRGLTAYNSDSFDEYVVAANKTYAPYVPAVAMSTQAVETQPMTSAATARSTAHEEEAASDAEAVAVEIVAEATTPAETNA
jgi:hypothetical protein